MSIKDILTQSTQASELFAGAAGLHCLPNCGYCCTNPLLETTVAEMLPMAEHLWKTSQAENVLDRMNHLPPQSSCVMYQSDPVDKDKGRCRAYEFRPGICRLFGYCARKDKHGQKQLVTCKVIKEHFPDEVAQAEKEINKDLFVPLITDHAMAVYAVDPLLGKEFFSINQALQKAIEREGSLRDRRAL